jgi:CheY-like chemotaxis protein
MSINRQFSILYIEDNEPNQQIIRLMLERRKDLTVSCADDGINGIKVARTILPDVILLDISLPDIDGYDVLSVLKNTPETAQIPIIAVSGDLPRFGHSSQAHLFAKYLRKPIEISPLYEAINEVLPVH